MALTSISFLYWQDKSYPFGVIVFTSWDYSVASNEAVDSLRYGIVASLKDRSNEIINVRTVLQSSAFDRAMRRFGVWFLWLAMTAGSFAVFQDCMSALLCLSLHIGAFAL